MAFFKQPVFTPRDREFQGFLEATGMSSNKTGWEMLAGIEQFKNFKELLKEALESAGVHRIWSAFGADFQGWSMPRGWANNSTNFYVVVRFDDPGTLRFSCKSTYVLEQYQQEWRLGSFDKSSMERELDLSSEEIHFFSRNLDSQMTVLKEFVTACLTQTTYFDDSEDQSEGVSGSPE